MDNRNWKRAPKCCCESWINARLRSSSKPPCCRDHHGSIDTARFWFSTSYLEAEELLQWRPGSISVDFCVFSVSRFKHKTRGLVINWYTINVDWLSLPFILPKFWLQTFSLHLFKTAGVLKKGRWCIFLCIAWLILFFFFKTLHLCFM